jgi:AraC-like DNA-binding protein
MDEAELERRISALIAQVERVSGLTLTVHDTEATADQIPLRSRHGHTHHFCEQGRATHPGYDRRCQEHCRYGLKKRAATSPQAFVHTCWKGGAEACAPVYRDGSHQLTVFGGITRAGAEPPADLAPAARRAWQALPSADPQRLTAIAPLLVAVGHGILALVDEARRSGGDSRKVVIEHCVETHLHAPLTIAILATQLGLSASRTAHLVSEHCGLSFGAFLQSRRLARAKHLLQTTDAPVGEIARRCGIANQQWFSRVFTRAEGLAPGRWRKLHRSRA